jgi:hypothetical protein
MKTRNASITLSIIIIILLFFVLKRWQEPVRKELFNRHPQHLVYTKHALCRMNCRQIDSAEVKEIMEKGIINLNRSDRGGRPCPVYALQGRTSTGESLRVIFGQCDDETKVITCYNLKQDYYCDCPGDENKTRNR